MTTKITQIFAFIVSIVALGLNYEFIYQLVFFGIPWSLIIALSVHYTSNSLLWQIKYFYIICIYLKIKSNNLNNELKTRIKNKSKVSNNFVNYLIDSYNEISDFDSNYWSTYLFWVLFISLTLINACHFAVIFSQMLFFMRIAVI
jgi:hypothetical protein